MAKVEVWRNGKRYAIDESEIEVGLVGVTAKAMTPGTTTTVRPREAPAEPPPPQGTPPRRSS